MTWNPDDRRELFPPKTPKEWLAEMRATLVAITERMRK
jgi:hypothetical protein